MIIRLISQKKKKIKSHCDQWIKKIKVIQKSR